MKQLLTVLALAFFVTSGCTCLDLAVHRAYACSPDGGSEQCPADGVCGLEGFCHARGDEQAWQCINDSHCEGAWRCGLEGVCHQIGDEQAWQCTDDSHCEGAWRCGPGGICLDPSAEALVPSTVGALVATQNVPALPPGLPAAVSGDSNGLAVVHPSCTQYPEQIDGGYLYAYDYGRHSTVFSDGGIYKLIDWSERWVRPDGGFPLATDCDGGSGVPVVQRRFEVLRAPARREILAAHDRERVTWALVDGGTVCRYEVMTDLTVSEDCGASFSTDTPPTTLRATFQTSPMLIGLGADHYQLMDLQDQTVGPVSHVFGKDDKPLPIFDLIAYGGSSTYLLAATPSGAFVRALDGTPIGDGGIIYRDGWQPAYLEQYGVPCDPDRGGYYYERFPVRFGLSYSDEGHLSLQVLHRGLHSEDGGFNDRLTLLRAHDDDGGWPSYSQCQYLPSPNYNQYFIGQYRSCEVCPTNSRTEWFHAREESPYDGDPPPGAPLIENPVKLEARCSNPDGGLAIVALDPTGSCNAFEDKEGDIFNAFTRPPRGARYERPLVQDRVSLNSLTVADDRGHAWRTDYEWGFNPWFLDRAPTFHFQGWSANLTAGYDAETYGRLFDRPAVVSDARSFDETRDGYVLSEFGEVPVVATIEREPSYMMVNFNQPGADPVIGLFELLGPGGRPGEVPVRVHARLPSDSVFGAPYHADVATSSDGRKILVVSTFDTVLAADITASVNAPLPTVPFTFEEFFTSLEPQVKFTAVIRSPVQSLVTLAAPAGAEPRYAEGYVLQASRVFRFRAPNFNVWRTEEIELEDDGEPLAVFADGVRGRVAMKSGRVYSLPTRFALANELPASAQPATQLHAFCGHVVAVAKDGVYRLAPGAAPIADWERLPLPAGDYDGARVYGSAEALRVYTSFGDAYRVTGFECRAPAQ